MRLPPLCLSIWDQRLFPSFFAQRRWTGPIALTLITREITGACQDLAGTRQTADTYTIYQWGGMGYFSRTLHHKRVCFEKLVYIACEGHNRPAMSTTLLRIR